MNGTICVCVSICTCNQDLFVVKNLEDEEVEEIKNEEPFHFISATI